MQALIEVCVENLLQCTYGLYGPFCENALVVIQADT